MRRFLVVLVFLAGCGSSSSPTAGTPTTAAGPLAPSPTPAPTPVPPTLPIPSSSSRMDWHVTLTAGPNGTQNCAGHGGGLSLLNGARAVWTASSGSTSELELLMTARVNGVQRTLARTRGTRPLQLDVGGQPTETAAVYLCAADAGRECLDCTDSGARLLELHSAAERSARTEPANHMRACPVNGARLTAGVVS